MGINGARGGVDEPLLDSKTPTLFVVGQESSVCTQDDIENLREHMKAETGLVVVGGADEHLRMSKMKKKNDGVTQSMVDRCIQDEISEFLCTVLTSSVTDNYERPEFDLEHRKKRDKDKDKDRKKHIHRDLSLELKGRRTPSVGKGRRNSLPTKPSEKGFASYSANPQSFIKTPADKSSKPGPSQGPSFGEHYANYLASMAGSKKESKLDVLLKGDGAMPHQSRNGKEGSTSGYKRRRSKSPSTMKRKQIKLSSLVAMANMVSSSPDAKPNQEIPTGSQSRTSVSIPPSLLGSTTKPSPPLSTSPVPTSSPLAVSAPQLSGLLQKTSNGSVSKTLHYSSSPGEVPLTVTSAGTGSKFSVAAVGSSTSSFPGVERGGTSSVTLAQLQQLGILPSHMAPSTLLQGLNFNIQRDSKSPVSNPLSPTSAETMSTTSSLSSTSHTASSPAMTTVTTKGKMIPSTAVPSSDSVTSMSAEPMNTSQFQAAVQQAAMAIAGKMMASYNQLPSSSVSGGSSTTGQVASLAGLLNIPQLVSAALKSVPPATTDVSGHATLRALESLAERNLEATSSNQDAAVSGQVVSPDDALLGLFAAQGVASPNIPKGVSQATTRMKMTSSSESSNPSKKVKIDKEHEQAIQKLQFHDFPLTTVSLTSSTSMGTVTKAKILKDLEKGNVSGLTTLEKTLLAKPAAGLGTAISKPAMIMTSSSERPSHTLSSRVASVTTNVSLGTSGPPAQSTVTSSSSKPETKLESVGLSTIASPSLKRSFPSGQLPVGSSSKAGSVQATPLTSGSSAFSTFGRGISQASTQGTRPTTTSRVATPTTTLTSGVVRKPSLDKPSVTNYPASHIQLAKVNLKSSTLHSRINQPGEVTTKAPFTGRSSPVVIRSDPIGAAIKKTINQPSAFKPAPVTKVISATVPVSKRPQSSATSADVTLIKYVTAAVSSNTSCSVTAGSSSQKPSPPLEMSSTQPPKSLVDAESHMKEHQSSSSSSKTASHEAEEKGKSPPDSPVTISPVPSPKAVGPGGDADSKGKGNQGSSSAIYMSTRTRRVRTPRQYSDYTE